MAEVPVANLYHLLAYAWNRLDVDWWNSVTPESIPNPENLLARLLVSGARWTIRKGLERGYIPREEVLAGLRGRVDFAQSSRRLLLNRGHALCRFDELEPDLLENRILKTTLTSLSKADTIEPGYRADLLGLSNAMHGVTEVKIHPGLFREVILHGRNRHYGPLLHLCELINDGLLAKPGSQKYELRSFTGDPQRMGLLFQDFAYAFWKRHTAWNVRREESLTWNVETKSAPDRLPEMRKDVVLRGYGRTVIVECKFTDPLVTSYRSPRKTFRSSHLYQLQSYLDNEASNQPCQHGVLEGLLLYPRVDEEIDFEGRILGRRIRLLTVDLFKDWQTVHDRMLSIVRSEV